MPIFMTTTNVTGDILVIRRDDNGAEWWLAERENDPQFIEWLEDGNEPLPWPDPSVK